MPLLRSWKHIRISTLLRYSATLALAVVLFLYLSFSGIEDAPSHHQSQSQSHHQSQSRPSRLMYIDVGAYDGDTLRTFLKLTPNGRAYELYAFECLPENIVNLRKWKEKNSTDMEIIEACASTKNGTSHFSGKGIAGRISSGGIEVTTVDFGAWLESTVKEDDFVVLKMDVEGAEFDILPAMIESDVLRLVDKMQLEMHGWLLRGDFVEQENEILKLLEENGMHFCFATYNVAMTMDDHETWEDPPKYVSVIEYPKPWVDLHFARESIDWVNDWA